jgi:UDP-glucose:(heptosyl)LPS alpha-1,3-glucosyltransferase
VKLLIARRGYSPTGGAEAYLLRFAKALASRGHETTLLADRPWPRESGWPGEIRVLPGRSPLDFARQVAAHPRGPGEILFSMERLFSCDCYRAGDGLHRAWLDRRARAGSPLAAKLRELRPSHRHLLALERSLFSPDHCRAVIANSEMVRDEIARTCGFPAERIRVIRNGVPPAPDAGTLARWREETRRGLGIDPDRFVLLFAGSGWGRKGLACAIRATDRARLAAPLLLVAGRGRPGSMPRSRRTRFLGPGQKVPALMAAADAFLLPTLYDPFSNASLEALSFGLPLLTTSANGVAEVIRPGEHGEILADPGDADRFARAIEAWADPARRAAAAGPIREAAAPWTVGRNTEETAALIGELFGGAGERP